MRAPPDPPPFEAHVDRSTGVPVVVVRGELDLATADQLWWGVLEASRDGAPITIDLSATTFMDSTGVTLLLRARGLLDGAGDGMVLRSPSEAVLAVLRLSGVTDLSVLAGDEPGSAVPAGGAVVSGRSRPRPYRPRTRPGPPGAAAAPPWCRRRSAARARR